jgi:general secretion pathway protein C
MLDTHTNDWMSRLQANGPKLVSFVLGALILLQVLLVGSSLISKPLKVPQPVVAPAPRAQRSGVSVQTVVSAHLFGVAATDSSTQDPENAPQTSANLLLAGTIATQDPKHGVAIISDGGGPSKVYSVGERVGGASLHSVYLDHVILDRGGALETLLLPRQLPPSSRVPAVARRVPGSDPRTAAAVDNIRRMVQQDPAILDQVMRTVASYDNAAGKLRGFRAYPGRNRAIFSKLGLKAGDLVTAINGTPLDDPQRSQDVFNTIQTSDHVTVTIERGGQKQDITLNIAQVAAQATRDLEGESNNGPPANGAAPPPNTSPNTPNESSNE